MNTFFKVFFACLLALLVAGTLFFLVMSGFISAFSQKEQPEVKPGTVLVVNLAEFIGEQSREDDLDPFTLQFTTTPGLYDITRSILHAAGDSLVSAVYLQCRNNTLGMAASQELGAALDSFAAAGKPVIAFADVLPQRAYEVAHHATAIYVQPGGIVEWSGLFAEVMFVKNLLDRLKIKPEIFYAGQFKSATEPFRLTRMSDANRLQYEAFLGSVQRNMFVAMARSRGKDSATLKRLADNLAVRTAEQAKAEGLIDDVLYHDQVQDSLRRIAGTAAGDEIAFMPVMQYAETLRKGSGKNRIAIVYANGNIVDGKGAEDEIGGDAFRKTLAKLREDDKVKAVVLRINSPGGSAIASEVMWRELTLLKKEKPLVVSMGNYAASGGYYIAAAADSIFAMPNSLTGSIGVFSILVDAQQMFSEKLGITFDGVKTNPYADFGNIARPMTAFEKQVAQQDVDSVYAIFKRRVSEGRGLQPAAVDSIAQGRIWSGNDARRIGLVDRMGGLHEAVACAARMAKLKEYGIREFPVLPSFLEKLLGQGETEEAVKARAIQSALPAPEAAMWREYRSLRRLTEATQARLPFIPQFP